MKHWEVVITHASGRTVIHSFEDREVAHSFADAMEEEWYPIVEVKEVFSGTREAK